MTIDLLRTLILANDGDEGDDHGDDDGGDDDVVDDDWRA